MSPFPALSMKATQVLLTMFVARLINLIIAVVSWEVMISFVHGMIQPLLVQLHHLLQMDWERVLNSNDFNTLKIDQLFLHIY